MKRVTLTVAAILLAVPAFAHAKSGIEFQPPAEAVQPGHEQHFNVVLFDESQPPGGGPPKPLTRSRPLVVFTSASGHVVRTRPHATVDGGAWYGTAVFPDKGPWHTTIKVHGHAIHALDQAGGFGVGTGLIETIPAAAPPRPVPSHAGDGGDGGTRWVAFLLGGPLLALGIWYARRRWPWEMGAGGGA
jgi:hypothetical protein